MPQLRGPCTSHFGRVSSQCQWKADQDWKEAGFWGRDPESQVIPLFPPLKWSCETGVKEGVGTRDSIHRKQPEHPH